MSYYKNDSGGNYRDIPWITALPTDSQIISSLFINYIDYLHKQIGIDREICVKWPIGPGKIY